MDIKEQNERLKSALIRLVDLKHYKDRFGKDEFYLDNQPEIWEFARNTLKSVGVKVPDTEANDNKHAVIKSVCEFCINHGWEDSEPEYCKCCGDRL
jgi:hypothetical protein